MTLCEQCNTNPTEGKLCAKCTLRNLAEMARRQGAPEAADALIEICHDSVPPEWVERALEYLITEVWKPTPLIIDGEVINQ